MLLNNLLYLSDKYNLLYYTDKYNSEEPGSGLSVHREISIISRRSGKFKIGGKLCGWVGFGDGLGRVGVDSLEIEGAGCACARAFHDVEINHGGFDAGVS